LRLPLSEDQTQKFLGMIKEPGRVFVYPTESFYALGCLANDDAAVQKIFAIKQRASHLPLLVLVSSLTQLRQFTDRLTDAQEAFLVKHMPGPLSVILPSKGLSSFLNRSGSHVAFRVVGVEEIGRLIGLSGCPWVGTSANLSQQPSSSQLGAVTSWLSDDIDLCLDGGDSPGGLPSTVLKLEPDGTVKILRPGRWVPPEV